MEIQPDIWSHYTSWSFCSCLQSHVALTWSCTLATLQVWWNLFTQNMLPSLLCVSVILHATASWMFLYASQNPTKGSQISDIIWHQTKLRGMKYRNVTLETIFSVKWTFRNIKIFIGYLDFHVNCKQTVKPGLSMSDCGRQMGSG